MPTRTTDRRFSRVSLTALAGVLSLTAARPAAAQPSEPAPPETQPLPEVDTSSPWRLAVHWENDGAFSQIGASTDRWYTNGLGITVAHQPQWSDDFAEWLGWASDRTAAGYLLGHQIYTPEVIFTPVPDPNDRPYAGYLYGGAFWQRERGQHLDHFELNLGVVGPAAQAEPIQTWIHETFEGDDPNGWDFQVENRAAVQAYWRRKWRFGTDLTRAPYTKPAAPSDEVKARGFDASGLGIEAVPHVGLAVGNVHRHAEAGATVRLGWRLPDDYGPGLLRDPAAATGLRGMHGDKGWTAYAFGRVAGRAVEHNVFIEGSTEADYGLDIDLNPLVGEATVGVVVGYRGRSWQVDALYGTTWVTEEFDEQDEPQRYTNLSLVLTGWF